MSSFPGSASHTPLQNPGTPPPPPPKQPQLNDGHPPSTPPKDPIHSQAHPGTDITDPTAPGSGPASGRSSAIPTGQPLFEQVPTQPTPPTVEDRWIPDILQDKSTADLHALLSNSNLISAIADTHPASMHASNNIEKLLATNTSLATHLLGLQSHLSALRASTEALLLQHQSLEVSWRKKQTEMDAALDPWSPKALYQRLVGAVAEQEAVCRAVEESFLEEGQRGGGVAAEREVAEWIRRIRSEGAKLEARREARARWDEGRVGGWR
ncbi:hypothetical protein TMEN_9898 [Trichophyton mentagrophytes]|uniref:VPS37 C-terminal domain-containing protein n=1 Tax=Trichophyton interdigitale (strain MR816) TaxID=1215338 RepID=A0A059IXW3_TRIIM|nr:hypothetical protein H101_03748 [Trichophyton interdigitale H6]KDB20268.1 hypothetical protein H109_07772 [Trichophyton interdigitale MR816]GBF67175.1 hypothetical protein TMEN_9898 [Trichophyton mentagrophytes]